MRGNILIGGACAVAVLASTFAQVSRAEAQGYGGYGYGCPGMTGMMGPGMMGLGMMGPGMMGPGMMGPGMMGPGMMGPGMMGPGWGSQQANLNLSVQDVKGYLERWVAMTGNPRLKVGNVAEENANTITADIVTTDKDALVQRFAVDRSSGLYRSVQ